VPELGAPPWGRVPKIVRLPRRCCLWSAGGVFITILVIGGAFKTRGKFAETGILVDPLI